MSCEGHRCSGGNGLFPGYLYVELAEEFKIVPGMGWVSLTMRNSRGYRYFIVSYWADQDKVIRSIERRRKGL